MRQNQPLKRLQHVLQSLYLRDQIAAKIQGLNFSENGELADVFDIVRWKVKVG